MSFLCQLYDDNVNLVPYVYNTFFKCNRKYYEDLMQEGYLELWRVANNFDTSRSTSFASYATTCIKGKMARFLNLNRVIIRPPESLIKLALKVIAKYGSIADAPKDVDIIAKEFGVSLNIASGLSLYKDSLLSLDDTVKNAGEETAIGSLIALNDTDIALEVEEKVTLEQFLKSISNERNKTIFKRVLNGEMYIDIADDVGLSYRQVGRIAQKLYKEYLEFKSN